jgi:uncharacterized membrane protein
MAFAFLTKVSRKWVFWVLVDILIFLVFALIAWRYFPSQKQTEYQLNIALNILHGQVPYVNFLSEYPPWVLFSFLLPALLFRSLTAYYVVFTVELLLFDLLAMALIARISSRLGISVKKSLLIHALVLIAIGPIIVASFDIIPAVLVLAALTFFISGRSNIAWAFVGLGVMTKLYPIIVAPFFVLYQVRQKQYKQIAQGVTILIVVVLALSLPWLVLNTKGFLATFTYHLERGLHSESTYGSILLVGKILGLVQVGGIYNFGSWNLYSPLADQLARVSFIIMAGLFAIVYLLYTRAILRGTNNPIETVVFKPTTTTTLVQYVSAAIFIFILSGKVFSMQYLVWLCPLLPLITGRWQIPLLASFLMAGAFSQFIYPYFYAQFEQFAPNLLLMMFARNVLLLVCATLVLLPRELLQNNEP